MSEPSSPQPNCSWEYRLTLPHHAIGSGVARTTVRSILTRHSLPGLVDTAELLTSELCGNAYRHTAGPSTVRVRWSDGTLHVSVRDGSDVVPRPTGEGEGMEGGRGLLLVSRCAQAWGSQTAPSGAGKVTWFELRG
ncbi:ATP-binding protein [Streptomyces bluensis]|uniref:ATP-binding protein n=1 Tax=Streptomyces bluensis TaxID=33897 RepID=UPI001677CC83|nr:ATP-binding protein [Streptomyces bluensis]GGZ70954.1 ATPase [Streptomyces bluensis]